MDSRSVSTSTSIKATTGIKTHFYHNSNPQDNEYSPNNHFEQLFVRICELVTIATLKSEAITQSRGDPN